MVGNGNSFPASASEDVALVEKGVVVDEPEFLDEGGAQHLPIKQEAGDGRSVLAGRFDVRPVAVCRPAVPRRCVGGCVAEGRTEEVAGKSAEMRRCVLGHRLAEPRRLVQHRHGATVALDAKLFYHAEGRGEADCDTFGFDLDDCAGHSVFPFLRTKPRAAIAIRSCFSIAFAGHIGRWREPIWNENFIY